MTKPKMNIGAWTMTLAVAAFAAGFPPAAKADSYAPSNYCSKPYKPVTFQDEWAIKRFNNAVTEYRRCIEDFVDEQKAEARKHTEAAEEAIEEWNNFVQFELR